MDIFEELLSDVADPFWKERVKHSVFSVLTLYGVSFEEVIITREEIIPTKLHVAAVEECRLDKAVAYLQDKAGIETPITVIRHKDKNVIFMGSNRSLEYLLLEKSPSCIVVKLPDHLQPKMISEATQTLKEIYVSQRRLQKGSVSKTSSPTSSHSKVQ